MSGQTLAGAGFAWITIVVVFSAVAKGLYDVANGVVLEWRERRALARNLGGPALGFDAERAQGAGDIETRLRQVSENLKTLQHDVDTLITERERLKATADHG